MSLLKTVEGKVRSSVILTVVGLILTGVLAVLHALPQTEIVAIAITVLSAILVWLNKPKP